MRFNFGFLGLALAALAMDKASVSMAEPLPLPLPLPLHGTGVYNSYNYHSFAGNGSTKIKKSNKLRYSHNAKIKRRKK